jgi:hypothetical protein
MILTMRASLGLLVVLRGKDGDFVSLVQIMEPDARAAAACLRCQSGHDAATSALTGQAKSFAQAARFQPRENNPAIVENMHDRSTVRPDAPDARRGISTGLDARNPHPLQVIHDGCGA